MQDILVDTSVWSLALRRTLHKRTNSDNVIIQNLSSLADSGRIVMIGPIRQEILSGIKTKEQFIKLRKKFRYFSDIVLNSTHYELAAHCFNTCRKNGIQGSNTDYLICAVSISFSLSIFTTDRDFKLFQKVLPIKLLEY